jgi:hypothetical protein
MSGESQITGGCQCGAIRYRSDEPCRYAVHCHCRMCQRSSGAAFMTWVCLPRDAFQFTDGRPAIRQSSSTAQRAFCGSCGAQIYMDYQDSPTIDVSVGTLDKPETISALDNIWVTSRLPLMKGFDSDIPAYPRFSPRT